MIDREKVIKGLEICSEHGSWHGLDCKLNEAYKDCPYRGCKTGCIVTIAKDALTLLKEQEAVQPIEIIDEKYPVKDSNRYKGYRCGKCKEIIPWDANYCPYCGRKVNWDD